MSDLESVSHQALVDWLEQARGAARRQGWAEPLDLHGIDLIDVAVSPLFLNLLAAARGGGSAGKRRRLGLRERAFRVKVALAERLARLRSAAAEPTDIVFWPRGPAHLEDMYQVWRALGERGGASRCLACQPKPFESLRARGMTPVFTGAVWSDRIRAARAEGRQIAAKLSAVPAPRLPPLDLGAGESGADEQAAAEQAGAVWRSTLLESLPAACIAVANARAALERFRPKVVVVGNDITIEGRAAVLVAKAAGVKSVVMMHGHVGTNNPLHSLHLADRLVAYGDAHRRVLVALGIAPEAISVCGAPYLDQRPAAGAAVHAAIAKAFSLSPSDPWVLVATSGPGHSVSLAHHLTLIENLLALSARLPEVTFIAKLHRKDNPQYYHDLMAKHPAKRRLMVVRAGSSEVPDNILDWLQGCRAVLTGASMVAIEAMLMRVPVITMDFAHELSGVEFIDAGATRHVRTLAELEDRLRAVLAAGDGSAPLPATTAFLGDAFFALDGRSAQRVADLLLSLAGGPAE
ncbi:MAG TPA: UDP-N-acetylglucosamine 2-epimerase [Pirellulales bacterium]